MEKYVVRRELATLLKQADYPQRTSEHVWLLDKRYPDQEWTLASTRGLFESSIADHDVLAAPMSDELLEHLPDLVITTKDLVDGPMVYYSGAAFQGNWRDKDGWHASMANALAEFWLWCKAKGLVEDSQS